MEVKGLENTWSKEITKQTLEAEKDFYEKYISEYPNSSLKARFMEEFKNSYVYKWNFCCLFWMESICDRWRKIFEEF